MTSSVTIVGSSSVFPSLLSLSALTSKVVPDIPPGEVNDPVIVT